MTPRSAEPRRSPMIAPGLLLGLGLGGFIDGILLHQILQWHHMVSHVPDFSASTVDGLRVNTLADGLFHLATWLLVLAGLVAAVIASRQGRLAHDVRVHAGLLLAGWGIFNVVEGLINHHLLQVHHVRDDLGGPLAWDIGFLLIGALLIAIGGLLYRRGRRTGERQADPA